MKCQNCQEPLEDSAAFCPECGTQRPANRTCIHCGSPVKVKQKFCSVCGKSPELTCQCGATLKPEQKFCKGCGKKVEQSSKKPVCPECGAAIEDQGPFCPDCGAAIANTSVTSTTGTSEPPEGEAGEVEKIRSDDNVEEPSVTETKITEPVSEGASTTHVCAEIRKATASDGDAEELTSEDDDDDDDDDEEEEEESETEDVEVKQPAEGGDDVEEQVPEDHDSKQLAAKTKDCEVKEPTEGGDDVEEQVAEDLDSKQLAAKTKDGEVKEPTEGGDDVEGQVPEDLDSKQLVVKTKDGEVKKPTEGGDDVEEQVPEDLDSKQLAAKTEDGEVKESAANRADGKESTTREEGGEELLDKTGGSEAKEEDTGGTGVNGKVDGGADVTGVPEEKDKIMQDADGKKEAFVQSDTGETKPETPTAEVEPVSTNEETVDKATSETGHETNEDKEADSSTTSDEQTPASALRPGDTEQLRASENNTQAEDQREDNLQKPPEDEESHGDTEVNGARQLATENDRDGQDDSPPGGTTEPSDKQPVPVQDEQPPIALPSEETPPENNQGVPSGPDSEVPGDTNLDQQKKKEEAAAVNNVEKTQQPVTDGAGVAVQTQQAAEPVAKPPEKTPIQETGGGASVQAGGTASETDGDQEIGATGSSSNPNSKTDNTKGEDTTDDDVGDNDAFDDDGAGSSKSREGSQHRGRGEKGKARPKKPSAKERKRQRKREKKQQQQPAQAVQPSFTVSFHVVISKKFKHMEANNHRVYLSWKPDEKQQSPDDLIEMHPKGRSDGCGELYETTVEWSHLPKNPNKTCYKYCVEVDGKFEWEKLYRPKKDKKKDSVTAREPRIPTQTALQKGTWDVYDWVAYPSGMTGNLDTFFRWTGIATSARDIFYRDLAPACAMFLPSPDTIMDALCFHVDSKGQCAEDFLNTVKILRRTPPFNVSQEDVDKFIAECVETALLAPLLERVESILDREHHTVVVCVFLVLLAENTKSMLTQSNRQIVFRALLIKPDLEKKICPEIPQLSKHFPLLTRDKKTLVRKLQILLNDKRDCDPSWIYCMPLLHLLGDDCREFQPPSASEEHRTVRWWGVEKVAEKTMNFKLIKDTSRSMHEVLRPLWKAIQADQLMLRTLVATLNPRQVLDFLATEELPAEIVIASVFYQLNSNVDAREYTIQMEFVDILKKTSTMIKAKDTPTRYQLSALIIFKVCVCTLFTATTV
ncbi:uncharacterized protein [Littorina saxatilis]|uniref:uncharacterized protein n=1 Tax=Littorina saxatilis TaxID=31220 RepID=UPI0038B6402B